MTKKRTIKEMLIRNVVLANIHDRIIAEQLNDILEAYYLIEECQT
jgi:hypothetical protein